MRETKMMSYLRSFTPSPETLMMSTSKKSTFSDKAFRNRSSINKKLNRHSYLLCLETMIREVRLILAFQSLLMANSLVLRHFCRERIQFVRLRQLSSCLIKSSWISWGSKNKLKNSTIKSYANLKKRSKIGSESSYQRSTGWISSLCPNKKN